MNVKTERTMMAAVLYGKEELRVEPVEIPTLGASDVLVKVNVALTCGTDLKVFRRGYHARMIVPPAVLGHELAGDIVEVGSQVKNFQVGQRVVAANSAPCENCYFCARRQENLCEDLLFNNGAYAEYIRIPGPIVRRNMYEIPPHVGYQDAALIEPLACVMRGLDETHLRPGDTVVVIGLGPIGLMFVRLAKTLDARVIAIGRRKTQLDRAASMGADELISTESVANVVEAVTRLVPGVMGNDESAGEESFVDGLLEHPQYTRPADFRGWTVPEVLRSGDHGRVARWRRAQAVARTVARRPDLVEARGGLSDEESALLEEVRRDEYRGPSPEDPSQESSAP